MLIGFFRRGSCVSLDNAAVNSATCSFSSFIRWQKSSLTRFLGVVHISLIFVYGMQFILYGLGDALNGGQIFCPGGDRDIRRFRGFLAVAHFGLPIGRFITSTSRASSASISAWTGSSQEISRIVST